MQENSADKSSEKADEYYGRDKRQYLVTARPETGTYIGTGEAEKKRRPAKLAGG